MVSYVLYSPETFLSQLCILVCAFFQRRDERTGETLLSSNRMENSNVSPERFPMHTTGDSATVLHRTQGQKFLSVIT